MTPLNLYRNSLKKEKFEYNIEQHIAIRKINDLYIFITKNQNKISRFEHIKNFLNRHLSIAKKKEIRAFYIWGSVGSGKTFIMDILYYSLQVPKTRMHYHDFLRYVDRKLRSLQGEKDPVVNIATTIAKKVEILCIDEMCINGASEAIVTMTILETLIKNKIYVIITSNNKPEEIYRDGIRTLRLLCFIKKIKTDFCVINLSLEKDYRSKKKKVCVDENLYLVQNYTNLKIREFFFLSSKEKKFNSSNIYIFGREIHTIKKSENVLWIDFLDLLKRPRSKQDYLLMMEKYDKLIINNVVTLEKEDRGILLCFIEFIDIIYDLKKSVIISGKTSLKEVYSGNLYKTMFDRTMSRITEMLDGYEIY